MADFFAAVPCKGGSKNLGIPGLINCQDTRARRCAQFFFSGVDYDKLTLTQVDSRQILLVISVTLAFGGVGFASSGEMAFWELRKDTG